MITIRRREVDVDFRKELEQYDFHGVRYSGNKFLAKSPFREERRPSFAVNLDTGVWIDSGSDDDTWKKGDFVKLLSYLRNETYEETQEFLLMNYATFDLTNIDGIELKVEIDQEKKEQAKPLDMGLLKKYAFRSPYLKENRGIDEAWQQNFIIGFDKENKAVTFPWFDRKGNLINIKFRSIKNKWFWYFAGGQPIKNHVYGLHAVMQKNISKVFIVESEIDALTLWQAGFPSVALGGANMTRRQRILILQSPIKELIIATDNDKAGRRIAKSIHQELNTYMNIRQVEFPEGIKDINELNEFSRDELMFIAQNAHEKLLVCKGLTSNG